MKATKAAGGVRVIGLGNPAAGDDSVGLEIVGRLCARGDCGCDLVVMPQAGVELVEALHDAEVVLFIDAVRSGAPLGTLHLVELPSAKVEPRGLASLSSHDWGLAEALDLIRALRRSIPRLLLLGVEIGTTDLGAARSEPVEKAIRTVVARFPRLFAMVAEREKCGWPEHRLFPPGDVSFPGCSTEVAMVTGGR